MSLVNARQIHILSLIVLLLLGLTCLSTSSCFAQDLNTDSETQTSPNQFPNPLGSENSDADVNVLIGRVINAALGVVGSLALLMFIYGGFTWMLAAGNNEKVEKGKNILIWATLGLIVIFSAYAIVNFVLTEALGLG